MRYLLAVYCLLIGVSIKSQISIKTNLPEKIALNQEFLMEVKIQKGPIKNFSKYQMLVPEGIEIREVDSKTGTFTFEANKAQIIWAITPPEPEFTVTMKFVSGSISGPKSVGQKFFYLERGEKRETDIPELLITVGDSAVSTELLSSEKEFVASDLANVTRDSLSDNPEEVKQQIAQLRKDSREAYEIGGREKRNAENRLLDADKSIKAAAAIKNPKKKKIAMDNAVANRTLAQNDLEVATRILSLAKSLEENAEEIEKLNQSIDAIDRPAVAGTETKAAETSKTEAAKAPNETKPTSNTNSSLYKPYAAKGQNLGEIQQQVMQIKRDSRQAYEVGEFEKRKAQQKLDDANKALKMASYMPEVEEKKVAIEKANADKARAEKDLEVAAKILDLAKSLEKNANDLANMNPAPAKETVQKASTDNKPATPTIAVKPTSKVNTVAKETAKTTTEPVANNETAKRPVEKKESTETSSSAKTQGLVYRVQIGSFDNTPDKSLFRPLGKVDVVMESGKYKALYGNCATKEDALKKRQDVIAKGFDGFVVSYQDGVRTK